MKKKNIMIKNEIIKGKKFEIKKEDRNDVN
jgi:hypothetical protein